MSRWKYLCLVLLLVENEGKMIMIMERVKRKQEYGEKQTHGDKQERGKK